MGNSQTKEARAKKRDATDKRGSGSGSDSPSPRDDGPGAFDDVSRPPPRLVPPRRGSRPDFSSILSMVGSAEPDVNSLEARRENKAEREARKTEKEKQARLKERERSMRMEHVDGGYLVTQGVYVGVEDYSKPVVRQLMIERRLAPFWRGLDDFSVSWAEHQIMAAARGMDIPPADEVPPELEYTLVAKDPTNRNNARATTSSGTKLRPPNGHAASPSASSHLSTSPSAPLFRARAKTLASLGTSRTTDKDMVPREFQLPPDPFVNGQPIEVFLYKDAVECPICVLYYPRFLNMTRCCEQPICSECFVQIKRPDPHPPEHNESDPNALPTSEQERVAMAEGQLVSEVTACPYCKQPEFGITYTPPPFRRGLTYGTGSQPYQVISAGSSENSLSSTSAPTIRRRGTSLSVNAPEVVTTDKVRPDWTQKLEAARSHAARRSAAASALHAAAYLMNDGQRSPPGGPFGRRNVLRRSTLDAGDRSADAHLSALRFLAERHVDFTEHEREGFLGAAGRAGGSRRSRMDDLEDMMMMEAIRLSLAAEEDRRRKEEKEAKKKVKKEEKEQRKFEKMSRKASHGGSSSLDIPFVRRGSDFSPSAIEDSGKGKSIERDIQVSGASQTEYSGPSSSQDSLTPPTNIPSGSDPLRKSRLRKMSNASSAASSYQERGSGTPPANEPLFNFQSLTALIQNGEKDSGSSHIENVNSEIKSHNHLSSDADLMSRTADH